jgi:GntR family transcriptional regulator
MRDIDLQVDIFVPAVILVLSALSIRGGAVAKTGHAIPKYYLIAQDIIQTIQRNDLVPGAKILSENEIIKKYGVSNTTARKSLQEVEHAGWVTKVQGRGTFVRANRVERSADRILSFTKNMLQAGRKPSTKMLDNRILREDYSNVINGRRYTMKRPIFKIHRLRFGDDVPMMLEIRYISMALCPGIDRKDLEEVSLYEIYEQDYNLHLTEVDQMLSIEMLGPGVKEFFDLAKPTPAFRVEGATFSGKGMIIEMEDSLYRADRYCFAVRAR